MYRLFAKPFILLEPTQILVDSVGNVYPEWKTKLDEEYAHLLNAINKEVNILDVGGIGDGKTDNTEAFKRAIGNGRVKVIVPEGVFITKGIRLPSWTILVGAGKGKTTIKLHDRAAKGTRLITNIEPLERKSPFIGPRNEFKLECRKARKCNKDQYLG